MDCVVGREIAAGRHRGMLRIQAACRCQLARRAHRQQTAARSSPSALYHAPFARPRPCVYMCTFLVVHWGGWGGGGGLGGERERRNIYNIYGTATLNPKHATQRRNITEGRWQRVNRVLQARLRGSACMREVAQAQKALRAVLQRFAKRSAHVATFRCVGAALGASGLLSVVLRAAGSLASSLVGTGCR